MCLARDKDGRNPLHLAVMKGKVDVKKLLVEASPHAAQVMMDQGETIVHFCVMCGHGNMTAQVKDKVSSKQRFS
ncbi:hypothetical protein ACSBR1_040931 [Camellia fascicularis]